MKIQQIHIDNFRHLENLTLDFTYQSGEKKGLPLEKVCLIGQSAAGKTSILEFIKEAISNIRDSKQMKGGKINLKYSQFSPDKFIFPIIDPVFYFQSEINSTIPQIKREHDFLNREQILTNFNMYLGTRFIEVNNIIKDAVWEYLLFDIIEYRRKLTQIGSDLVFKGLHSDIRKLEKEMSLWKKINPNPLIELAEKCLNPILKRLNLEVDVVDTSSYLPLKPIHADKPVPSTGLSTGTKQILLSALPLYKLETDNSIILMDEPERSLYPDLQIELMSYYQNLAPNAQFIVATHSPFIAAAFEPEERFILYFDENGKVQVRNGVSPIGDDPNDILRNDFELEFLMNQHGINAYKKYLNLKQQMSEEQDVNKKKKLLKEVVELGDNYKF